MLPGIDAACFPLTQEAPAFWHFAQMPRRKPAERTQRLPRKLGFRCAPFARSFAQSRREAAGGEGQAEVRLWPGSKHAGPGISCKLATPLSRLDFHTRQPSRSPRDASAFARESNVKSLELFIIIACNCITGLVHKIL